MIMKKTLKKITAVMMAVLMIGQIIPALAGTQVASDPVYGNAVGYRDIMEIIATKGTYVLVGQTLQLDVNEGYKPTWSSDNEAIATVDANGLVTAVAAGEVTINAEEGRSYHADVKITVIDPEPIMKDAQDQAKQNETAENSGNASNEKTYMVIVVNAESARYEYDGQSHTLDEYVATSNDASFDAGKIRVSGDIGVTGTNCGTYQFELDASQFSYADDSVIATFQVSNGWLKIRPAKVTITADSLEKNSGDPDPQLTATVEGLIGQDTVAYTLERYAGETAGQYIIEVQAEEQQGNYSITTIDGKFTINKTLLEYPLYNIAQVGSTYYRLRKTTIKTDLILDDFVSKLTKDGNDIKMTASQYQAEDYDFANEILTYNNKKYAYISRANDNLEVDGYYTVTQKAGDEVTAVRRKIGGMTNGKPNWLIPEDGRYNDPNAINSFHRNYIITFTEKAKFESQFKTQDLYSLLSVNGNSDYYRLKKSTFSATRNMADLKAGTSLKSDEYIMTPYDFTNVVITIDGVDYIYSKQAPEDEYVSYYTVEFENIKKEDRINGKASWYADDSGFLDNSKSDYANLPNETQAFHANYKATLHKGKDRPARRVTISSDWPEGKTAYPGAKITLTATVFGFGENVKYQWQRSAGNNVWEDIPGENGVTYTFILDDSTIQYIWRVVADD